MTSFSITPAASDADLRDAAWLLGQYAASLPVDLDYQDFASELAHLPGKYAGPGGDLLLAHDERGGAVGCVGVRPLPEPGACEMKRLFILPAARGSGLGRALAQAAIARAAGLGYGQMRLDTLAGMQRAIGLYGQLGFQACDPYYAPTPPGTLFMSRAI